MKTVQMTRIQTQTIQTRVQTKRKAKARVRVENQKPAQAKTKTRTKTGQTTRIPTLRKKVATRMTLKSAVRRIIQV